MPLIRPHPRYQSPLSPIVSIIDGCGILTDGIGHIHVGRERLSRPPTPTSRLMLTLGYLSELDPSHTVFFSDEIQSSLCGTTQNSTNFVPLLPAAWASNNFRTTVTVGDASVPAESYPLCSPHPMASRSYAMLDITNQALIQYHAGKNIAINVFVEGLNTLLGGTFFAAVVCWCEPIVADVIINDAVRLARSAALEVSKIHRKMMGISSPTFSLPIANTFPLSRISQQLLETERSSETDDIQFIGSSVSAVTSNPNRCDFTLVTTPIIEKLPVSFRCPLTYSLMTLPGKGAHCSHQACFDISTYVRHCLFSTNAWNCPICNAEVRHTDIVLSSTLEDAMVSYGDMTDEDDCDGCYLLVDVSDPGRGPIVVGWEPSEAATELFRQREVDDDGCEGDEYHDRKRPNRAQRRRHAE